MKGWIKGLLLAAGLGVMAWYIRRVGITELVAGFRRLGWWAPVALLPYLAVYVVDAIGWRWTLPSAFRLSFWQLLRIRWAGESLNNMVPSGHVGGEALKVVLLGRHGISTSEATTAAVVSKTCQTAAQLIFIAIGASAFLLVAPRDPALRAGTWIVLLGGSTALGLMFWIQRRGIFKTATGLMGKLGWRPAWIESRRDSFRELDDSIGGFYSRHPRRFVFSTAAYLCGWMLDATEIAVVAWGMGQSISSAQAISVEAFTGMAKLMGMWIPAAVGVQESGLLFMGRNVGLPVGFCLSYALLRRAREVIFACVGWALGLREATAIERPV